MDATLASLAFLEIRSIELELSKLAARLAATLLNAPLVSASCFASNDIMTSTLLALKIVVLIHAMDKNYSFRD